MRWLRQRMKKVIAGVAAALLLAGAALAGCASDDDRESGEQHAEREQGEHGGEGSGEHGGEGREGSGEHGGEGSGEGEGEHGGQGHGDSIRERNEAEMSSPITPLDQQWTGNLGGLEVDAWFEEASQTAYTTVRNTTGQTLCFVQSEPHLKSGTRTVGELGPDRLGDLKPGQETMSVLSVSSEPAMDGVSFDGYVVHLEVFECGGPGPIPHNGEGGEEHGSGGEGGGEHGSGGEVSGEHGGEGREGSTAAALAPEDTYDETRYGARLIMSYDAAANAFTGTVENTTNRVLTRARVEIHLSNGTELGPTTPTDLAPGQVLQIRLPSTTAPFTSWTTHAEIGNEEHGSGGEGHGSGGESGGEHGSCGEHGGGEGSGG